MILSKKGVITIKVKEGYLHKVQGLQFPILSTFPKLQPYYFLRLSSNAKGKMFYEVGEDLLVDIKDSFFKSKKAVKISRFVYRVIEKKNLVENVLSIREV